MKLAVLGTDFDVIQLIAAAKSAGHEIVWLGEVRPNDAAAVANLIALPPSSASDWELLLDHATADAVLVGQGTATGAVREEQLKRLVAAAIPLLVAGSVSHSVLPYYELDMIRRETSCVLRHYNPLVAQPLIADLSNWVRNGHPSIGTVQQVACQRQIASAARETVLDMMTRDVELLAAVAGDIRQVSAVGPRDAAASFASLQAQMATPQLSSLRWSVAPSTSTSAGIDLTLIGERGTLTMHAPEQVSLENHNAWHSEISADGRIEQQPVPPFDAPRLAIDQLAAAVRETDPERRAVASTWQSATQAMEVVDAAELSLQKGRVIPVHQQQLTEQVAFRGTMAAFGCGIILLGLIVFVFAGLLGVFESESSEHLFHSWPIMLLALLAAFLLLQIVPMLATKRHNKK